MWIGTYGNLFKKLANTTYEIPIAIYRSQMLGKSYLNEVLLQI